jgi:flagellar hook-associated protein 3 FlgL
MDKLNKNTKNTLEIIYGNIQNVDTAKLAVQLSQQTIAYQATLSATAKITQLSILDYLK